MTNYKTNFECIQAFQDYQIELNKLNAKAFELLGKQMKNIINMNIICWCISAASLIFSSIALWGLK